MTALKICAWCNRDASGRIVCFKCGSYPAPNTKALAADASIAVRVCDPCHNDLVPLMTISHTICRDCEREYFGSVGKLVRKETPVSDDSTNP